MDQAFGLALWQAIEQYRLDLGWSKTDLERESGIPRSTFHKMRTNPAPSLARTVDALARAVGMPISRARRLAGLTVFQERAGDLDLDDAIGKAPLTWEQKDVLNTLVATFRAHNQNRPNLGPTAQR